VTGKRVHPCRVRSAARGGLVFLLRVSRFPRLSPAVAPREEVWGIILAAREAPRTQSWQWGRAVGAQAAMGRGVAGQAPTQHITKPPFPHLQGTYK